MEKLMTVVELSERLGLCTTTVYRWLGQKDLPCVRLSSRCVRFREGDVEKWLEQVGQHEQHRGATGRMKLERG
jgi:excisionase family DNA binding protein